VNAVEEMEVEDPVELSGMNGWRKEGDSEKRSVGGAFVLKVFLKTFKHE